MKMQFRNNHKQLFSDKLIDLGHLIFGGTFVTQFISGNDFSFPIAAFGFIILVTLYSLSYFLIYYDK